MKAKYFIRHEPIDLLKAQIEQLRLHNEALLALLTRPVAHTKPQSPVPTLPSVVDHAAPEAAPFDFDDEPLFIPVVKVESVKVATESRTDQFDQASVDLLRNKK